MVSIPSRQPTDKGYINSPPISPGFDRVFQQPFSSSDDEEDSSNLSASSSTDDLNTVEVVFNKIYLDPLQEVMEEIDAEAASILRTGKLTVHGEAGDMNILQPLLFSLQASDPEISVLHPQLLQNPFFMQRDENFTTANADMLLRNGCIRLGVMVDHMIYKLLSTHCCKGPGSKQADMLIETALKTVYTLPTPLQRFEADHKNSPPLVLTGYNYAAPTNPLETIPDMYEEDDDVLPDTLEVPSNNYGKISRSSGISSSSSSKKQSFAEEDIMPLRQSSTHDLHSRPRAESLRHYSRRKDSTIFPPSQSSFDLFQRRPSDQDSEASSVSSLRILSDTTVWQASLSYAGDMIVGAYGVESTYPILFWNSDLKVTFKLGTTHSMSASTLIVDNSKELLKLKVVNTTDCKIGFAIRSHRQSMMFRSHVIFPKDGLHLLDPQQEWTVEAEFMGEGEQGRDEYICIDLLVCQLNSNPSWNVIRRYAVLKQNRDQHKLIKKLSRNEAVILPGAFATHRDLGNSLKQVILHGLQCVVKNKLDQAEIIFTQALHLPLFQRSPLKAFAYICLAVTANKRRKKAENTGKVGHVLKLVNSMDKLVEACESSPNMRMPKMIGLIKQLKKELNPAKVVREQRQNVPRRQTSGRLDTTDTVDSKGGALDLSNVSVVVPGGALSQPVTITLGQLSIEEIHQSLQPSPWSSMLNILTAVSIQCSPPVERFNKPVIVTTILSREAMISASSSQLRLLQSNYMSTWVDVTDDPCTEVTLESNGRLTIRTDQTGWITVASLQFDINKIMPLAVKSVFAAEPIAMDVNAYGHIFPDGKQAQISVFITPHQENTASASSRIDTPPGHKTISFPHTFRAYKNQTVRLSLQGQFEPNFETGQTTLQSDIKIDGYMEKIFEKMVKITTDVKGLYGKLTLSTYNTARRDWEKLQEINLSSPTNS